MKKKTSLADIAKALGVSKTLVSMVLNGKGNQNGINEDTQKRVWAKAKELNYKPNLMARSLRTGKSNTIGLIVSDISNAFYAQMCRAVEDAANKQNYTVLFGSSDEKPEKEQQLIQMLRDRLVDGLVLSTTQDNIEGIQELKEDKYPFVLIDRTIPSVETPYVTADNFQGGRDAVQHLIDKGYRRIGLLRISPSHLTSISERVRGYREALETNGIAYDPDLVREVPYNNIQETIATTIPELLALPEPVEAIFVLNNNLATGALQSISKLGLKIPEDIALLSFDDIDLFRLFNPAVSVVAQPIREMGTKAVELLIEKINNGEKSNVEDHIVLPTELIVRKST